MDLYLRATYIESFQPSIMNETVATFPEPEMTTITYLGTKRQKIDGEITYLEKKNIGEAIRKKLRKKDV